MNLIFRYWIAPSASGYGKVNDLSSNFTHSMQLKHVYVINYYFSLCLSKAYRTDLGQVLKLFCMHVLNRFSCVQLFATLWAVAYQAPLCMRFSRQGYWSGFPCSSLGDLLDPGIKPVAPVAPASQAKFFHC